MNDDCVGAGSLFVEKLPSVTICFDHELDKQAYGSIVFLSIVERDVCWLREILEKMPRMGNETKLLLLPRFVFFLSKTVGYMTKMFLHCIFF